MTQKDYTLIGGRIRYERGTYRTGSTLPAHQVIDDLALALSEALQEDNPRFKKQLFLDGCGANIKLSPEL